MGIYVYMLRCADNSYYIGSATGEDLAPRIAQHQAGSFAGYTSTRLPVTLVWSEYFARRRDRGRTPTQRLEPRQEGGVDPIRLDKHQRPFAPPCW